MITPWVTRMYSVMPFAGSTLRMKVYRYSKICPLQASPSRPNLKTVMADTTRYKRNAMRLLAHVRRKFLEAVPGTGQATGCKAEKGIRFSDDLFLIERDLKDLDAEERLKRRLKQSKPVVGAFWEWIKTLHPLPKSALGKAIGYATRQKTALSSFLLDGYIPISNNADENAIRLHLYKAQELALQQHAKWHNCQRQRIQYSSGFERFWFTEVRVKLFIIHLIVNNKVKAMEVSVWTISCRRSHRKLALSERRMQKLCEEERIPGVVRFGRL